MHIPKAEIPVKLQAPGAVARMLPGFGNAQGYSKMSAECFTLAAGTDIGPLLQGLKDDLCQAPHWGYLSKGELTVTYRDGSQEHIKQGDIYFWPPGHTVRVEHDAELIMFSPEHEHGEVIDHMRAKLG